jgi:NADPH:quinone reductase-like Zn-dependent oxidoreductase
MKAIFIRRYGGPEVLEYGEFSDPVVGSGDVLIKVAAAAINPIDIMERSGLTKDFKPVSFPGVLGWALSGTVVGVGPSVVGFSIGDKVLAWAYHTYAELCVVKAELLAKFRTVWISLKRPPCRSSRLRETSWFRSQPRSRRDRPCS